MSGRSLVDEAVALARTAERLAAPYGDVLDGALQRGLGALDTALVAAFSRTGSSRTAEEPRR